MTPRGKKASRRFGRAAMTTVAPAASGNGDAAGLQALEELIRISHTVGADPDLVQGGGGNTSVKTRDGRSLLIKASGFQLGEMDGGRGWVELDLERLRAILARKELPKLPEKEREVEVLRLLQGTVLRPRGARPSVEASLHALLDRVVIHTHPIGIGALLASKDSRKECEQLLDRAVGPVLYVPYVDPGYTLALRVESDIRAYQERHGSLPRVVLLENHGLFVAAPEVEECVALSTEVTGLGMRWAGEKRVNAIEYPWIEGEDVASARRAAGASTPGLAELRGALLEAGCAPGVLRADGSRLALRFLGNDAALKAARRGAFTPDQIVYARSLPCALPAAQPSWPEAIRAYRARIGADPRVVLVPAARGREGLVCYFAPDLPQLRIVSEVYRSAILALLAAPRAGGPRMLDRRQTEFIEGWEVEKFRAALLAGAGRAISGRIAVVTGAGSGLGKGIASGLVEAGATVFGLDVSEANLHATAATLPRGKYVPLAADVTSEDSVQAAFGAVERSAGGLDFLINAAGIAPSYPLVDFPVGAWRKTLEINLTGYFLCAREATRTLLRQGVGGAIINLASKSGLEASKENSAYNATKAGEIHLMRGWALELGKAGIRVNSVAPGNVFKGSQIWNEEYIKACAKKKGIQPEEVIPYYTSLAPLGKEIEPRDISDGVLFLLSDAARNITGQTLVIDGGQVMVR